MNQNSHDRFAQIDDMLKMNLKSIEDLKWRFRRNHTVLELLDEQTDLLMENASQAKTQQNLLTMVRKGQMSDMTAAVLSGAVARAAQETMSKISINGMLIKHVLIVLDTRPPAAARANIIEA